MAMFEIDGKEHELKIVGKSIKQIDKRYEGGTKGFLSEAMQGSLDAYTDVVYYGLVHTGEGLTRKKVDSAIEEKLENEELSLNDIYQINNEVVLDSFFFKEMVQRMINSDPEMKKQLEAITK